MIGLDTPVLTVDEVILKDNIKDMSEFAKSKRINLRPHIKTHKTPEIAKIQLQEGACGITVSKLGEAEVMIGAGIKDIFIAYQIVSENKLRKLVNLAKKAKIKVGVDSVDGVRYLSRELEGSGLVMDIILEVNSGLDRCGVMPSEALNFAREVLKYKNIKLNGVFTHAGQVYSATSPEDLRTAAYKESYAVLKAAESIKMAGVGLDIISVGSTPTVKISGAAPGVTEIRPGNYVFYDAIQVGLGVVSEESCALRVLSTVISKPAGDRIVIDAGGKTLALDKGAHGANVVQGFGIIRGYPHLMISRLSEEHGIVTVKGEGPLPEIGEVLEIIPNHACTVVNLADKITVMRNGKPMDIWKIAARGKVV